MKNKKQLDEKIDGQKGSGLLVSAKKIHAVRSRDEQAMSDGGGTGRSDANDKTKG